MANITQGAAGLSIATKSYMDTRFSAETSLVEKKSTISFPFWGNTILVANTKCADYFQDPVLADKNKVTLYRNYTITKEEYATKAKGTMIDGLKTFYNQDRTESTAMIMFYDELCGMGGVNVATAGTLTTGEIADVDTRFKQVKNGMLRLTLGGFTGQIAKVDLTAATTGTAIATALQTAITTKGYSIKDDTGEVLPTKITDDSWAKAKVIYTDATKKFTFTCGRTGLQSTVDYFEESPFSLNDTDIYGMLQGTYELGARLKQGVPISPTSFEGATKEAQLAEMTRCITGIGREAINIIIAEETIGALNLKMRILREADTQSKYCKILPKHSLLNSEEVIEAEVEQLRSSSPCVIAYQKVTAEVATDKILFNQRLDFMISGSLFNPIAVNGKRLPVGLSLDCLPVNISYQTNAGIDYPTLPATFDYMKLMEKNRMTFLQPDTGDDKTHSVVSGGGVFYQNQVLPVNVFLLAKLIEYMLLTSFYREKIKDEGQMGLVTAKMVSNAQSIVASEIDGYLGNLIDNLVQTTYTQGEINDAIQDDTLKILNAFKIKVRQSPIWIDITYTMDNN